MARIKIISVVEKEKENEIIDQIYKICRTDADLSPRPMNDLINAYNRGDLFLAFYNSKLAGWLLRIPYNHSFQELAAGFVLKEYRPKGTFSMLVNEAIKHSRFSCIVTFNNTLADYFRFKGFRKSSLWEAFIFSRGRFLLNRINYNRLKAIRKHYQKNKPVYLLFQNNE